MSTEEKTESGFNKKKVMLELGVLIILAVGAYYGTQYLITTTTQPIAFNHKRHVIDNEEDSKLNCLQCHVAGYDTPDSAVEGDSVVKLYKKFLMNWKVDVRDSLATEKKVVAEPAMVIPNIEFCATCHEEMVFKDAKHKTEALKQIIAYSKKHKRIEWQRNYRLADHLMYSHAKHIGFGGLDCSNCHGDVANMSAPITSPRANTVSMYNGCLACHKEKKLGKLSSDCLSCHK